MMTSWQPHARQPAAYGWQPYPWPPAHVGQLNNFTQQQVAADTRERQVLAQIREAFREVTPALVLTGIAIGIASGIGSTIGTALGTILLQKFLPARDRRR